MEMTIQTRGWSESRADCINVTCKERKDKVQYIQEEVGFFYLTIITRRSSSIYARIGRNRDGQSNVSSK